MNLLAWVVVANFVAGAVSVSSLHPRAQAQLPEEAAAPGFDAMINPGPPTASENMRHLLKTVAKFKAYAEDSRKGVETRHRVEEQRLEASLPEAVDQGTALALKHSVRTNTESLLETRRIYNNMVHFASSMEEFLKVATSRGLSCDGFQCGPHSSCTETATGPQCACDEGHMQVGDDCKAPLGFRPHRLLYEAQGSFQPQAADMHVALFGKSGVVVVFRDKALNDIGRAVVGHVGEADTAVMSPPETFTAPSGKAYSPIVAGTEGRRVLIAWRDRSTGGLCWMRGAALGISGIRGATQHLTWGEPANFCHSQSHKMAIAPFHGNRVGVFFVDKAKATPYMSEETFGNSVLLNVGERGAITKLGSSRFADGGATRLEVTQLTPKTFILAARAVKATDDMDPSIQTNQEALALFGEMSGDNVVFDSSPLNLEPTGENIWARGVSLIAPNTFAYAYQRGLDPKMMLAVARINASTNRMEVVHEPSVIREGFSPYVSMLSVPYSASDPHTLTLYQGEHESMMNVCSWDSAKHSLGRCEDFAWLQGKVQSVSGVHLGGGRSFMAFTAESGVPYYMIFGLSKK